MKAIIGLFVLLFIVVIGSATLINGKGISLSPKQSSVTINKNTFLVEVEKTEPSREKGLSGRSSLQAGHGMLFLFDKPNRYAFWMKDMKFPIDMVFINGSTVVNIFPNVPFPAANTPDSSLPLYIPTSAADKVLEINANTAQKDNIKNGDTVSISL